jgi:LacI family transcriptional regulator
MVTIKDIAQRAGVSFSTVSKALRNSPLVHNKTKQQVLAVAKEMGYQPNFAARSLVSKKTGAIGVIWPSIERAALSSLITGLNENLEKEEYTTLLSMSKMESAVQTFRRFQVDAILVFGDKDRAAGQLEFDQLQIPVLTYGAAGYTPFSTVDVNRGQAIRLAVRHLAGLGHQDIAYIGEPQTHDPLQVVKIEAFKDETARLGLRLREDSIIRMNGLEFHDGYVAAQTMLKRTPPPTAVISGGIDLTRGILRAVSEQGLVVPRDLSVVSYDNLPQMEDLDVPTTVVGVAIATVTSVIAKTILELIEEPKSPKTIFLEPELVIRSSSTSARQ